jgi:LacI family transcriptional regulator
MAMEFKFAGVILMTASESPELCRLLAELECPVVLMNRYLRNMPNLDYVIQNNFHGAYEAVSRLIEMGHYRIFHLAGIFGSTTADDRMMGYKKAMADAGYKVTPDMIVEGNLKWKFGYEYSKRLIEEATDATALFIGNDTMALGFISGWTEGGRCIPDDMSILCFDYTPLMDQMAVKISTVGVDAGELGSLTAKLILERISGSDKPPQNIVCQPQLRVRSSVGKY